MSPRDKGRLLREFAEWAKQRGLSAHRHDAQFRGVLRSTTVEIETGIRDSALYTVVCTIHFGCGLGTQVLRADDAERGGWPVVRRLRSVFRHASALRSIRLDDHMITARLQPGSGPAEAEDVVDAVLSVIQSPSSNDGPYR